MLMLPQVKKTRAQTVTKRLKDIVAGVLAAATMALAATTAQAATAPTNDAVVQPLLMTQSVGMEQSHYSHYSHSSHQSHYSHYSSRW